jgi:hypothetical protein
MEEWRAFHWLLFIYSLTPSSTLPWQGATGSTNNVPASRIFRRTTARAGPPCASRPITSQSWITESIAAAARVSDLCRRATSAGYGGCVFAQLLISPTATAGLCRSVHMSCSAKLLRPLQAIRNSIDAIPRFLGCRIVDHELKEIKASWNLFLRETR